MNRREQLQDRYEDALFALLMDEIGEAEGKQAQEENERLKNDPTAAIPEDVDKRCLQTIRREFAKRNIRMAAHATVKTIKRTATAAGFAAILFMGAFTASATFRANTMNFVIEVFETHTAFRFSGATDEVSSQMEVGWLPEGFSLKSHGYDSTSTWYQYQGKNGESLHIEYALTSGSSFFVDTEEAEVSYVEIHGTQAMLVEKGNELQLVWAIKDNTAFFGLIGTSVAEEDLVQVANGLKY